MIDVHIGAIGMALGEPAPISELARSTPAVASMQADGLALYRRTEKSRVELGAMAFGATLARWGGPPDALDMIIYCTDTDAAAERAGAEFYGLCADAGLSRAPVVGVGMSGCANLGVGLRLARAMLRAEGLQNVAVVSADTAQAAGRIPPMDLGVLSDGAASCILSQNPLPEGFRLLGFGMASNHKLRSLDWQKHRPRSLLITAAGIRDATQTAVHDANIDPAVIRHLIPTTVRRSSLRFFADACRISPDQVFAETLPDTAHVFSADLLINLERSRDWRRARGLGPGAPFLGLSLGPVTWTAAVLAEA